MNSNVAIVFFFILLLQHSKAKSVHNVIYDNKYDVLIGEKLTDSHFTMDVFATTLLRCVASCLEQGCSVVSYSLPNSLCRIHSPIHNTVETEIDTTSKMIRIKGDNIALPSTQEPGSEEDSGETSFEHVDTSTVRQNQQTTQPSICTDCKSFQTSLYKLVSTSSTWDEAVNHCTSIGGKLVEVETEEENNFLMVEVYNMLDSSSYWLGGYNFHQDNDLEWRTSPDQPMLFTNWYTVDFLPSLNQPDNPADERCLLSFMGYGYSWGDWSCNDSFQFVCEFQL